MNSDLRWGNSVHAHVRENLGPVMDLVLQEMPHHPAGGEGVASLIAVPSVENLSRLIQIGDDTFVTPVQLLTDSLL